MKRFTHNRDKAVNAVKRFRCAEVVELVTAYLEDALDEPARLGMEQHLACCRECDRRLDQFRAVIGVLGALPSEDGLRGDVRDRLMSAFRDRRHRRP
ncbi:hypothetical protein Plo01_63020 [Planobispora longispora]|uniref:Putative zinc-finger domain-containing protein n=1 Tax=Planobispora longispora TaxID=28887 RepID=A0A8J3RXC8_9ACTN|nr:hypothetical protein Plo01_63020 [Planobispora longispora]